MALSEKKIRQIITEELEAFYKEHTPVDEGVGPFAPASDETLLTQYIPRIVFKTSGSKMPPERQFVPNVRTGHTKLGRVLNRLKNHHAIAQSLIAELEKFVAEAEDEIRRHKQ
jgi:hypothetical protein